MANLRAGLIGYGMMGRNHARVLSSLAGVELVAIADSDKSHHAHAGQTVFVDRVEEIIQFNLDYCFVAVPTALHEQVGLRLAEAGIHTLMEKPLASDYSSALCLTEAFENMKLIGAVGHIERYNASIQQAKSRINNGELGEIYQISTRRQNPFPKRILDVGVVRDLATHDVDLTMWITDQEYAEVNSQVMSLPGRKFEDLVSINARLSKNTIANHLINWVSPYKERLVVITGSKGAYVCDTLTSDLTFYSAESTDSEWDELANFRGTSEGDVIKYAFQKSEPLRREHENFRDAVLGKKSEIVSMRQGLKVIEVSDRILAK
jgi:UDP-N-acetylglucosamine 3-dehydrogenase